MVTPRDIAWIKSAKRDFDDFPPLVREDALSALSAAALGFMPDSAKPLKGLGSGVFELVLSYRGDAFRVVYVVQIGAKLWVVHAFQKKSTKGIKTPKVEIDRIRDRIKRLRGKIG